MRRCVLRAFAYAVALPSLFVLLWITYTTLWFLFLRFDAKLSTSDSPLVWDPSWITTQVPLTIFHSESGQSDPIKPTLTVLERPPLVVSDSDEEPPPLLFLLHGFPESAWLCWHDVLPVLSPEFHVIVPDQRGYNTSYSPDNIRDYSVSILAEDIVSLISHYRVKSTQRVFVAAHDWGANVAWEIALAHPGIVDKFVIANVPHPAAFLEHLRSSLSQIRKSFYIWFFQIPWLPEWVMSRNDFEGTKTMIFQNSALHDGDSHTFKKASIPHFVELWSSSMHNMVNWYRAALRYPSATSSSAYNQTIEAPVLIIWGENDVALDLWMAKLSLLRIPNGRLDVLPGSSHWVTHDRPNEVAKKINRFCQ